MRLLVFTMLICGLSLPCEGQSPAPTGGQAAEIFGILGGAIGVGVYFIARAPRTTGCVVRDGGALALASSRSGDPGYLLEGDTGSLHEGERVKVVGRRHDRADQRVVIRVKGVAKRYGACSAVAIAEAPAMPKKVDHTPESRQ